jgi:four helix bundle protein
MLHIYNVILCFIEDMHSLLPKIAHHDPDLARQLRRASTAVALNVAEAWVARGRSRTACYNIALREMRECCTALEICVRLHYVPPLSAELEARCQRILGTLYKLSFPRAAAG